MGVKTNTTVSQVILIQWLGRSVLLSGIMTLGSVISQMSQTQRGYLLVTGGTQYIQPKKRYRERLLNI